MVKTKTTKTKADSLPKKKVGLLADFRKSMPAWPKPSCELLREMRDEDV
jgi:hypothetical protein